MLPCPFSRYHSASNTIMQCCDFRTLTSVAVVSCDHAFVPSSRSMPHASMIAPESRAVDASPFSPSRISKRIPLHNLMRKLLLATTSRRIRIPALIRLGRRRLLHQHRRHRHLHTTHAAVLHTISHHGVLAPHLDHTLLLLLFLLLLLPLALLPAFALALLDLVDFASGRKERSLARKH